MNKRYCSACDRVNGKKALFCGSCGQSLTVVGTHIERFSFRLWRIVLAFSIGLLPATLAFAALGTTYWAVEAYETMTSDAPFFPSVVLGSTLLLYSALYVFMLSQFSERRIIHLYTYGHLACAVVGVALSGYFLMDGLRMLPSHDVLQRATSAELTQITFYVFAHYAALLLFYIVIVVLSLRVLIRRKKVSASNLSQ